MHSSYPARALLAIALVLSIVAPAGAADFELKFAHVLPPIHHHFRDIVPAWSKRIESQSNSRIRITQYPSGQLLPLAETYDGVKAGVADIGFVLTSATPGRFPVMSIAELPFMFRTAVGGTGALMELQAKGGFDKEFADMQVLYLHVLDIATLHTRNAPLRSPDDLKRLRVRFISQPVRDLISAYGATPVGIPTPQIYENLERGVVDGGALGWDSMISLRLGELVKHHLDLPLFTLAFCICMSKKKFDAMPAELQKVMMQNSGMEEALRAAASYDKFGKAGYDLVVERKHTIHKPTAEAEAQWRKGAQPVIEAHLKALEDKGISARSHHKFLLESAAKHEKK